MFRIERSLEIAAPLPAVHAQWSSFEELMRRRRIECATAVDFEPLDERRTRVAFRFVAEPDGFLQTIVCALGFLSAAIDGTLSRFKLAVESRQFSLAQRELRQVELDRFRALL